MAGSTFGTQFRLTTFGESHGPGIGGIIDGCPAGLKLDLEQIQSDMARRRPGQSETTSPRKEEDTLELLSGLLDFVTTGTPIGFFIRNADQRPADYDKTKDLFRPSHADFTYQRKYGLRDHRGSGRASARETVARVAGGAVARQFLEKFNIRIGAFVSGVGPVTFDRMEEFYERRIVDAHPMRCPDAAVAGRMQDFVAALKSSGDTCGGTITCIMDGLPVGIGEPVFDKLSARLAYAMMGINAAHGFEYGIGFSGAAMKGSECNDRFVTGADGSIRTSTNHSGGIQGGLSNGMPVVFRVAFKPVSTIRMEQSTVDTTGAPISYSAEGRHDACVVPRAVPIVEAMAALTLADLLLQRPSDTMEHLFRSFN